MTLSWKEFKRELVKIAKQYDLEVFENVDRKNRLVRTVVFLDKSLENKIAQVEVSKLETLVDAGFDTRVLYKIKKVIERNLEMEKNGVDIRDVTYSGNETIVEWTDGTKTVVTLQEGDRLDPEKGLAMAIAKKHFGNTSAYYDHIKKWLPKENTRLVDEDFTRSNIPNNEFVKICATCVVSGGSSTAVSGEVPGVLVNELENVLCEMVAYLNESERNCLVCKYYSELSGLEYPCTTCKNHSKFVRKYP